MRGHYCHRKHNDQHGLTQGDIVAITEDTQALVQALDAQTAKLDAMLTLLTAQAVQGGNVIADVTAYLEEQRAALESEVDPAETADQVPDDVYPFLAMPTGTTVRELPDGSRVFTLVDGTVIRAQAESPEFTVISPEGGIFTLTPVRGILELPDSRQFALHAESQVVSWTEAGIEGLPGDADPSLVDADRYMVALPLGYTVTVQHDVQQVVVANPIGTTVVLGLTQCFGVGESVSTRRVGGGAVAFSTDRSGHYGVVEPTGVIHLTLCTGREIVIRLRQAVEVPSASTSQFVCECDVV